MKSQALEDVNNKSSAQVSSNNMQQGGHLKNVDKVLREDVLVSRESSFAHSSASSTPRSGVSADEVVQVLTYQTLARQLEYYFSTQNLQKDTYLQTLRDLNDGCVPVKILAGFAMVQAILTPKHEQTPPQSVLLREEQERILSIQTCVANHTDLLDIYHLDPRTGRRLDGAPPSSILVVGPKSEDRLPTVSSSPFKHETECSNVIILRDVQPTVTETEVRELFEQVDDCPNILNVVSDVAHHWFITLDTNDRTQSMRIMMQLRTLQFRNGDYAMARLRASVISAPVDVYSTLPSNISHQIHAPMTGCAKKKKVRRRSKKKNNKNASNSDKPQEHETPKRTQEPLLLTAEHFPSLQDERVEWETAPVLDDREEASLDEASSKASTYSGDDDEPRSTRPYSDVASTATTTSSTATGTSSSLSGSEHVNQKGYAAAVLKTVVKAERVVEGSEVVHEVTSETAAENETTRPWGPRSQSFADIVRSDKHQQQQ